MKWSQGGRERWDITQKLDPGAKSQLLTEFKVIDRYKKIRFFFLIKLL